MERERPELKRKLESSSLEKRQFRDDVVKKQIHHQFELVDGEIY